MYSNSPFSRKVPNLFHPFFIPFSLPFYFSVHPPSFTLRYTLHDLLLVKERMRFYRRFTIFFLFYYSSFCLSFCLSYYLSFLHLPSPFLSTFCRPNSSHLISAVLNERGAWSQVALLEAAIFTAAE
jgi:hypothetical protein